MYNNDILTNKESEIQIMKLTDAEIIKRAPPNTVMVDNAGRYYDGCGNLLNRVGEWANSDQAPEYPVRLYSDIFKLVHFEKSYEELRWRFSEVYAKDYAEFFSTVGNNDGE